MNGEWLLRIVEEAKWLDILAWDNPNTYNADARRIVLALLERDEKATLSRLEASGLGGSQLSTVLEKVCQGNLDRLTSLSVDELQMHRKAQAS